MKVIKFGTLSFFLVFTLGNQISFAFLGNNNNTDIEGNLDTVSSDLRSISRNVESLRRTIASTTQQVESLEQDNQRLKQQLEQLKEEHPTVVERTGQWLKDNTRAPSHNNYDDRR